MLPVSPGKRNVIGKTSNTLIGKVVAFKAVFGLIHASYPERDADELLTISVRFMIHNNTTKAEYSLVTMQPTVNESGLFFEM